MTERHCTNCGKPCQPGDTVCHICGYILPISPTPTPSAMVHRVLQGRYELQELMHSGGMGYIYLAKDKRLYDRLCVAKQIKEPIKSEIHQRKLEEEAMRMAKLNHPSVAMVLDHLIEDNFYFLIVELIHGKTLSEIFKQRGGKLLEEEVIQWAIEICSVVEYLHQEGIVHRDISPDNIMLNENGIIKFIDFGTLRELTSLFARGTVGMGKFGYTPPEQWQGKPEPRSDIFALGATIYYLLTGFLPLSRECLAGQAPRKEDFRPRFPPIREKNPALTPHLEGVLQKALQLDAENRYSSAAAFSDALKSLEKGEIKAVPILNVGSTYIGLSPVKRGTTITEQLIVKNSGRGRLIGKIKTSQPWLKVSPTKIDFESGERKVLITVNTKHIDFGMKVYGFINILSNGGNARIEITASTIAEPVRQLITCTQCGGKNAEDAIYCKCGHQLKPTTRKCSKCKAEIPDSALFCRSCGSPL